MTIQGGLWIPWYCTAVILCRTGGALMTRKSRFAFRLAVVLVALLTMNGYVSAMKFSQPVELGSIFNTPSRGFIFKGENSNNGKSYGNAD